MDSDLLQGLKRGIMSLCLSIFTEEYMDLGTISAIAVAVLVAAVVILKVIAPKTETTSDDKALSIIEKILALLGKKPTE